MIPQEWIEKELCNWDKPDGLIFQEGVSFAEEQLKNQSIDFAQWLAENYKPIISNKIFQCWVVSYNDIDTYHYSSQELFEIYLSHLKYD